MTWSAKSRKSLALIPFSLPLTFIIPYALFVERFRVLIWVWQSLFLPFWISLSLLIIVTFLCAFLLYRLLPGALAVYTLGLGLAIAQPAYLAMREHRHFLLVLIFALLCGQVYLLEYLRGVLILPFYSARRRWWESYPKAIPNLHVILYADENKTSFREARLANFGRTGCFVFCTDYPISFAPKQVAIKSGDSTLLERPVEVAVQTRDSFGLGLRFLVNAADADWNKDLEDYLSYLRRSGYVEG